VPPNRAILEKELHDFMMHTLEEPATLRQRAEEVRQRFAKYELDNPPEVCGCGKRISHFRTPAAALRPGWGPRTLGPATDLPAFACPSLALQDCKASPG
jgi:hypothetical protein